MTIAPEFPTARLSSEAAEALVRVESRFPLIQAVAQYKSAAADRAQLAAVAESGRMSNLDADSLAHAEELMADAWATLAEAGRLDLIGGVS